MAVTFLARHLTSLFNALTSSKSRSYLIGLKQHTLYHLNPEKKFIEIDSATINPSKRVAFVSFSNSDLLIHGATKKINELTNLDNYEIVVCRWSDPKQLKKMMEKTNLVVNKQNSEQMPKKINKLIFFGHGVKHFIQGGWPFSNGFLPTSFTKKTLQSEDIDKNVDEDGEIVLFSCSTGTPGGLAQELSLKTKKRQITAATEPISHMQIGEDKKIHFIDKLFNVDQTITWKEGEAIDINNEHDKKLIEEEKEFENASPQKAKEMLDDLKTKKAELISIRNKNLLKSIFSALFFAIPLSCLLIFLPLFFITMTVPLHIIQGVIILFIWYVTLCIIRSGAGNKLHYVNELIAKAKQKSEMNNFLQPSLQKPISDNKELN